MLGVEHDPGARLRLARTSASASKGATIFEAPLGDLDVFEIDALPAGSYRVSAEVPARAARPKVYGEARVELVAGRHATVTLSLEPPEVPALVPLEGTLELPAAWHASEFELELQLLDAPLAGRSARSRLRRSDMLALDDPPERFHWSAGDVQPGRYQIDLLRPSFGTYLVVGPAGEHDARIVVPPPCDVVVRCVDRATGADVDVERLRWSVSTPKGRPGIPLQSAQRDASRSRWVLRVPAGTIELRTQDLRYEDQRETVEVAPGTIEVELRLAPATGLLLELRDDDTQVAWDPRWKAELVRVEILPGGKRPPVSSRRFGPRLCLNVRAPGSYRLVLGEIPGYQPVPEQVFEIERGARAQAVIELRRR